jgi:hypothetical protein
VPLNPGILFSTEVTPGIYLVKAPSSSDRVVFIILLVFINESHVL